MDGSGYLDVMELRKALQRLEFDVTTDKAAALLKRFDANASRRLELDEFRRVVHEMRHAAPGRISASSLHTAAARTGHSSAPASPTKSAALRSTSTQEMGRTYVVLASHGVANATIQARRRAPAFSTKGALKGRHDLERKLEAVGLVRYHRKLQEMGFESVAQLLMLGRTGESLDDVIEALHPYPGHKVQLWLWLRNEAAAADAAMRQELKSLRAAASVDQLDALKAPPVPHAAHRASRTARAHPLEPLPRPVAHACPPPRQAQLLATCKEAKLLTERLAKVVPATGPNTAPEIFLRRLRRANVSRAWNQWREKASVLRESANKLARAATRLRNRPLSHAWNAWSSAAKEARRQKDVAQRVLRGWLNQRLLFAWNKWSEGATAMRLKRQRGAGALKRATNSALTWAFMRIRAVADERRALHRAVAFLFNRELAWAITQFKTYVAQVREKNRLMAKVMGKLMHKELAGAFTRWAERGRGRGKVKGVVARVRNKELTWGFMQWKDNSVNMSDSKRKLRRLLSRLMNRGLARAWAKWEADSREGSRMRGMVRRMLNRRLTAAWCSWAGSSRQMSRARAVWARVGNLIVWKCLRAWMRFRRHMSLYDLVVIVVNQVQHGSRLLARSMSGHGSPHKVPQPAPMRAREPPGPLITLKATASRFAAAEGEAEEEGEEAVEGGEGGARAGGQGEGADPRGEGAARGLAQAEECAREAQGREVAQGLRLGL
jgi:hypothetical protein